MRTRRGVVKDKRWWHSCTLKSLLLWSSQKQACFETDADPYYIFAVARLEKLWFWKPGDGPALCVEDSGDERPSEKCRPTSNALMVLAFSYLCRRRGKWRRKWEEKHMQAWGGRVSVSAATTGGEPAIWFLANKEENYHCDQFANCHWPLVSQTQSEENKSTVIISR